MLRCMFREVGFQSTIAFKYCNKNKMAFPLIVLHFQRLHSAKTWTSALRKACYLVCTNNGKSNRILLTPVRYETYKCQNRESFLVVLNLILLRNTLLIIQCKYYLKNGTNELCLLVSSAFSVK